MKKVNRNNGAIDVTTVGGRIKKLRTAAGYTQEELAARLQLEGKSAISNYENNSRDVSAEPADYILNGKTPDNLDTIVNEAIEILNNLKTDKAILPTVLAKFNLYRTKMRNPQKCRLEC